jgi:hypothetical protein
MQSDNEPGRPHAGIFSSDDVSPVAALARDLGALVDKFEAEIGRGVVSPETAEQLDDLVRRLSQLVGAD